MWASHQQESFESRVSAQQTGMTILVQGFACDPAKYEQIELVYLHSLVKKSKPRCFWTGVELALTPDTPPRMKLSVDRTTFVDGRALGYGSKDQVLVAASHFSRCTWMGVFAGLFPAARVRFPYFYIFSCAFYMRDANECVKYYWTWRHLRKDESGKVHHWVKPSNWCKRSLDERRGLHEIGRGIGHGIL